MKKTRLSLLRAAIAIALLCCITSNQSLAQRILAGPMLGYIDMREACIWVQTIDCKDVTVEYWADSIPKQSKCFEVEIPEQGITHCVLTQLEPGVKYYYTVAPGKEKPKETLSLTTQALWQYRTDPPNFRLATGSCTFISEPKYDRPGKPYGGEYGIFDAIEQKRPDLMLWLGDNIYLREVDFGSKSGIYNRYNHTRQLPEMQKLLKSCPHYAIWDDHDFGPNDSNGSYIHKDWTWQAFQDYWANPSYGLSSTQKPNGITCMFQWSDIDFFLLDNRFFKVAENVVGQKHTILGEAQINWLIQALKTSRAPFKMVAMGGQFLNSEGVFENYAVMPEERQSMLDALDKNEITGVVFLTGDRHSTELSMTTLPGGAWVYDLTTSPLTSGAHDMSKEQNANRVAGTLVGQRNFSTLDFSGPRKKRQLSITVWDNQGKALWTKTIDQPTEK
jgi:alkaline phosphatase D